ncbi:MAG: serine/threonine protein kinase [Chloroflexi bacterium]|nr:serine/threonine protein kinase [Chloroflexota bacterium]
MSSEMRGYTLGQRYRFDELLGQSAISRTYRITDLVENQARVAKVLWQDVADLARIERFKGQVERLARLDHPHIARFYDLIELDGHVFILTDYIAGHTLNDVLTSHKAPLKAQATLTYLTPLAAALHYAHSKNVLHLNLKPTNMLIDAEETLFVTDFFFAYLLADAEHRPVTFYCAPELVQGQPVTVTADVYALGVMMYQLFTWRLPFQGDDPEANGSSIAERIAYEHIHLQPKPPRLLTDTISSPVEEIILRCLDKDPARRYSSVQAWHEAFTEAVGAPPLSLESPTPAGPLVTTGTGLKLPEWSQLIEPAPEADPDRTLQHHEAVPDSAQASTMPHLESDARTTMPSVQAPAPPTISSMDRYAPPQSQPPIPSAFSPPPPPSAVPAPPAYIPPPPAGGGTTSPLLLAAIIIGTVLALAVACIAGAYLMS